MLDDVHAAMVKMERAARTLRSLQTNLLKVREEMPMKSWCGDPVLVTILQDTSRSVASTANRIVSILEDAVPKDKG